jgi:MFS family permease
VTRSLWRHGDFLKLWTGQTVSRLGSQVSMLALPLIAITLLKATTLEVGLLTTVEFSPFILVGLPAGVWVDRLAKRPVLVAADLGRLIALLSIPLTYELGSLSMGQLYVVSFITGVLTVFFDVAYQSYLPELVARDQLVDGNAKLATTESAAQLAGPTFAGLLIDLIGASLAVIADAVSFAVSAISVSLIRQREREDLGERPQRRGMKAEIGEGLGYVLRHPLLRPIAGCTATSNLFSSMQLAVITVFMVRSLGMSPGLIGVTLALGNIGVLLGALIASPVARRLGRGTTILGSIFINGIGCLLFPVATRQAALPWLIAGGFLASFGSPVYNINQVSLRQAITPHRLQGRMNASMRFLVWGTMPLGSAIGGVLGTALGLRAALWIGGAGAMSAFLWILLSPVRALTEIPDEVPSAEELGDPAPGIGGVVGPMGGAVGVMDEGVLGLGVANDGGGR